MERNVITRIVRALTGNVVGSNNLSIPAPFSLFKRKGRFKPTMMLVNESEIKEIRQRLEELVQNPRPSDGELDEEAQLTARLIGYTVLWVDAWANEAKADYILLGEDHAVTAQNLVQPLLALHRGDSLGRELSTNFLIHIFDVWAHREKYLVLKANDYPKYQVSLEQLNLNNYNLMMGTDFTPYSSLSNQWAAYVLYRGGLAIDFNDHAAGGYGNLIIPDSDQMIFTGSLGGMARRNRAMIENMTNNKNGIQQLGLAHVAGLISNFQYSKSVMAIALNAELSFIAPIFDQEHYEDSMPALSKNHKAIRLFPIPGRAFDAENKENYSSALERDYLQAVLGYLGFDAARFEDFLKAREKARDEVTEGFKKVYGAMHST